MKMIILICKGKLFQLTVIYCYKKHSASPAENRSLIVVRVLIFGSTSYIANHLYSIYNVSTNEYIQWLPTLKALDSHLISTVCWAEKNDIEKVQLYIIKLQLNCSQKKKEKKFPFKGFNDNLIHKKNWSYFNKVNWIFSVSFFMKLYFKIDMQYIYNCILVYWMWFGNFLHSMQLTVRIICIRHILRIEVFKKYIF